MTGTPAKHSLTVLVVSLAVRLASAQVAAPLNVHEAVTLALRNYPSIQVSQEQLNAASEGIRLARTAYLPRVDTVAQANRGTRNNVFGILLPQSVIPPMSGPVIGSNNTGTAFGSALGASVTWEPFDFGLRNANVETAAAQRAQSEAALKRTQYEVAVSAADAFLTLVAAGETVRAAQAGVDRADAILKTVQALADAQLRPGADVSRSEAELAAARTQLIQASQAADIARATLCRFDGCDPTALAVSAAALLQLPPEARPDALNASLNPIAIEQSAALDEATAQLRALERSYFPRFYLQGAVYARGTGAETDGKLLGGVNGLAPTVQDFALGLTVTFPVTDLPALRAREAQQAANVRAQAARSKQIAADLQARWNIAAAMEKGARQVAANTPVEISAARATLDQATARYKAGLGNMEPVAEAQRLLTQAEIDDGLARLGVWRGLLAIAAAVGDLQPFLAEAGK